MNDGQNHLFRNDNGLEFVNVTTQAGVGDTGKGSSASWGDFDKDGDLDLYVANWLCDFCLIENPNGPFDKNADKLYSNNGDGTFSDVSNYLDYDATLGAGFIGRWTDYDNDGDLDMYVINDKVKNPIGNVLWRNDGTGCNGWCFTDVSELSGTNIKAYGMGLAVGDYDNDGDLDFYFTSMNEMFYLLQNNGDGTFDDVTIEKNILVGENSVGWGSAFFDYDYDMDLDLYIAISNNKGLLYQNNGSSFDPLINYVNGTDYSAQGVAIGDYNNDGKQDILIGQQNGRYYLLENQVANDNNYIAFDLIGEGDINFNAIGSKIFVTTESGITQMREISSGQALGGGSDMKVYFGLKQEQVKKIKIIWPNNNELVFDSERVNKLSINQVNEVKYLDFVDELSPQDPDTTSQVNKNVSSENSENKASLTLNYSASLFLIIAIPFIKKSKKI